MAGADLTALSGARRGGGATIGRNLADRQRFTAVLDGGVGLRDAHGHGGARIGAGSQGQVRRAGLEFIPVRGGKVLGCYLARGCK
jgi:hypothetical protein